MTSIEEWRDGGLRFAHRRHNVFYRRDGRGPVLLCLHGFPTASWDWHKIWPGLTKQFDCIAPDFHGFGFSDKPLAGPYTIVSQADLCEALCDDVGVESVYLLAHDYGDTVAQELLARYNERRNRREPGLAIQGCCFLNGGLFPDLHRPRLIQKLLASPLGSVLSRTMSQRRFGVSLSRVFGPETHPSAEEIDAFWRLLVCNGGQRVMPKLIGYMRERRLYEKRWTGILMKPVAPMRLIDGCLDPVSGGHLADHYADVVPGADVVRLASTGHYPQFEAPDETLRHILSFFRDVASGRPAPAGGPEADLTLS